MADDLQDFYDEFFQEIVREAEAEGRFNEDAFFDLFCEQIVEAGDLETADHAPYVAPRGIRIDGYGGDPTTADGTLSLIIADFNQSRVVSTLTASDMEALFRRATAFLEKSLQKSFRNSLEETSPGFGLADLIAQTWSGVTRVRILLISNRVLSSRVDGRESGLVDGRPTTYSVWDLGRLQRFASSGKSREDIVVEMAEYGAAVPALRANLAGADYEAYLLALRGDQLAAIYGRWGARLLEQNVRVFLQARGNVNKGIRNTLDNEPEMFFAYNNGVTATAEAVIGETSGAGLLVTAIRNLQIVNGGQTTASVFAASQRKAVDLSRVYIQVKLSVIPPERAELVVPKISEFANSQNKVNAADFFANHPYHLRLKAFSEVIFAPSQDGAFRDSKWFYERARGQYQDARGNLSVAARKKFDLEYPKRQLLSKTDLAKMILVWEEVPQIVSRGAQKNFAYFAAAIGHRWDDSPDQFNERYFREAIAKAIVFRETERLVTAQPWYEGGYRANIVAFAIAKLAHDVRISGQVVDFDLIWRTQGVPAGLQDAIVVAAEAVQEVLVNPPSGVKNVTEWAKRDACWSRVASSHVRWPESLKSALITAGEQHEKERAGIKDQRILNGIDAQTAVVNAGSPVWRQVRDWALSHKLLSQKELEILAVAGDMPARLPSEKQAIVIMESLRRVRSEGCPYGEHVGQEG